MSAPKFTPRQARAYKARHGMYPHEAAGLVRVYTGRGARRNDLVGLYRTEDAGMGSTADGDHAWTNVCERHGTVCSHPTRALADSHTTAPEGWCEGCQDYYGGEA